MRIREILPPKNSYINISSGNTPYTGTETLPQKKIAHFRKVTSTSSINLSSMFSSKCVCTFSYSSEILLLFINILELYAVWYHVPQINRFRIRNGDVELLFLSCVENMAGSGDFIFFLSLFFFFFFFQHKGKLPFAFCSNPTHLT